MIFAISASVTALAITCTMAALVFWRWSRVETAFEQHAGRLGRLDGAVTAIHFIGAFDRLIQGGRRFHELDWAIEYWRIHTTEYQFARNGALPVYIFELWMIELVLEYAETPETLDSHRAYLEIFEPHNPEISAFFADLANIAVANPVRRDRVLETARYVRSWHDRAAAARPRA